MFLGFTSLSILSPTILKVGSNDWGVNSGPKNVSWSMLEEGELDSMEVIEESSELSVFSCKGETLAIARLLGYLHSSNYR